MRVRVSIFLLSILLVSAGARWLQLEYCYLDYALNTSDSPCSCMLTSFNPQQDATAIPVASGISTTTMQMCDIICETNAAPIQYADIIIVKYYTPRTTITKGFLQNKWQPPELKIS